MRRSEGTDLVVGRGPGAIEDRARLSNVCPSGGEPDWDAIARHGPAIATVRAFGEASGAERVAALVDGGSGGSGVVVEWTSGAAGVEVTVGEVVYEVPSEALAGVELLDVPVMRAPPATAIELDVEGERVLAPVGVVAALADGVLALARALGGRTVASADFPTSDPGGPLTLAAREGEGVVAAMGELQFAL